MAVPDPKLAEEHLRILTQAPHIAGSPEDKATAEYVAKKFREAGLDTEIVEYKVWLNYPAEIRVDMTEPPGVEMHGPQREHVDGDPFQDDPRVVTPYNGMSPSGDAEAEVVYANYGSPADFDKLKQMNVDVRGKIVIVRYGENFRGVKEFVAQERGAAGVIIYSDPKDDGYYRGDAYPKGPWRPASGVQRGSVGFMFQFPGDPTTPGVASTPTLPEAKRVSPAETEQMPKIPVTPLSYADASPILEHLGGPLSPREWQGGLPFTYHVGPGPAKVKMHLKQDYQFRTIWDVIGKVRGTSSPDEWVVAGNHRDAWVYGAVDPNSGTAAMLEAVHGLGELLKSGWKPKRTIVFASWDAEEEGLIGSTEWGEDNSQQLGNADAYFNMDVAVSGKKFGASGVPSLKEFIREIAKSVPSPQGGTVYDRWKKTSQPNNNSSEENSGRRKPPPTARLRRQCRTMCLWAISAVVPTTPCSCSIWVCLPPISVRAAITGCITPCSITSPGSRNSAIPTSAMSSRWPAFTVWKSCACPTPTCCLTITRTTERKFWSTSTLPEPGAKSASETRRRTSRQPSKAPATCRKRVRKCCKNSEKCLEHRSA